MAACYNLLEVERIDGTGTHLSRREGTQGTT